VQVGHQRGEFVRDHLVRSLLVINHFLDQVNFAFERLFRGHVATLDLGSHLAQGLHLGVRGLAARLVEAGALVKRAVAERRGVVLGGAAVGHLPDDARVNQPVRLVHLVDNAVLVVADRLRVQVVLHGTALAELAVARVLGLLSRQQRLTPINNSVFSLNSLLAVEVEDFLVGVHREFVGGWEFVVSATEASHVFGVFSFDGHAVRRT